MDITLERILSLLPHNEAGKIVHGERQKFAQSVGLKNGNLVSDWEKGRTTSYTNYLYEIAAKYNVSLEWLRGETDEKRPQTGISPLDDELNEYIQLLNDAPPEIREAVKTILKGSKP